MSQLSLNWPSDLQSPQQQTEAIQKAFSDIQQAFNSSATSPSVLVHVPSFTNTTQSSPAGSYATLPGFNWTINSQGGLVCIDANISAAYTDAYGCSIQLVIDGKAVLNNTALSGSNSGTGNARGGTASLTWKAVLGSGQHTIQIQAAGSSTIINGTGRGNGNSSASIIEFPANVQVLNAVSN